jgi:8-oxo-dGTP diphosphatase
MQYIGKKLINHIYEKRRAVYGIIFNNNNEIAIIDIDSFGYNLPGGKIEENEDSKTALIREMEEETGFSIKELEYIEELGSYHKVVVRGKKIFCECIADFYKAKIDQFKTEKIEKSHHLIWMKPEDIKGKMYFEFHNYIIEKMINYNIN